MRAGAGGHRASCRGLRRLRGCGEGGQASQSGTRNQLCGLLATPPGWKPAFWGRIRLWGPCCGWRALLVSAPGWPAAARVQHGRAAPAVRVQPRLLLLEDLPQPRGAERPQVSPSGGTRSSAVKGVGGLGPWAAHRFHVCPQTGERVFSVCVCSLEPRPVLRVDVRSRSSVCTRMRVCACS